MYILFGAGAYAKNAVNLLGSDNIRYCVDNNANKRDVDADIPIYTFEEKKNELKETQDNIMLSVSFKHEQEIAAQLKENGISKFVRFSEYHADFIRKKIAARTDYLEIYRKAMDWIKNNTINNQGIVSADMVKPYPEVSGYYIPSLLYWGERDLALSYSKWLCSIQKDDGSWYDKDDKAAYIFDTAQILKGLLAIRDILPEVDRHIKAGCEWMISLMLPSGRLPAVDEKVWGTGKTLSELIHIYCLSPLKEAGAIYGEQRYVDAAKKCLAYYLDNCMDKILNFGLMSHFYAYVMEGLIDMGRDDIARKAMENLETLQKDDGSVPGYCDVNWVCSTGLFQFALVWFRLGNIECGNKAFEYACKLQNESGGWYGSYYHGDFPHEEVNYLPNTEISWAVKYFLDALKYKAIASFEIWDPGTFFDSISKDDKKYLLIKKVVEQSCTLQEEGSVLEVGSFHGRYLRNLLDDIPSNNYYAVDISSKVLSSMDDINVEKKVGALTYIPYDDGKFEVVYACEALEHAVDIEKAVREVSRVLKTDGVMIFIDKNISRLGVYDIEDWEQWFDEESLKNIMEKYCSKVDIVHNVENLKDDKQDLFSAWIGTKK